MALSAQEIITRGFIDVHVRIAGIRQCHRLVLVKENAPNGWVPYLVTKVDMPIGEMLRMAGELNLPIKSPKNTVFPRGKGPMDFINIQQ